MSKPASEPEFSLSLEQLIENAKNHEHLICGGDITEDKRFLTTNPLVNKEDIEDHYGVGGVFHKDNKILVFWHNKYQYWTMPVGKCPLMSDPDVALIREMEEEVGVLVHPAKMECIGTFVKHYYRGNDVYTRVRSHVYDIHEYIGTITNLEPEKHPIMEWRTLHDLAQLNPFQTSDMLRFYIALKEIIAWPSKQLLGT